MITIIDYGAGNLASVSRALTVVGAPSMVATHPHHLDRASGIILPGVGAFGPAARQLERTGFAAALRSRVHNGTPLLGICLGLQLLFGASEEVSGPPTQGLSLFRGTVRRFLPGLKVPHIGWNMVTACCESPLLRGLDEDWFYFVHSYYPAPADPAVSLAVTDYGLKFASVIGADNVFGVQFHPEKSGQAGLKLLTNFARICKEVC